MRCAGARAAAQIAQHAAIGAVVVSTTPPLVGSCANDGLQGLAAAFTWKLGFTDPSRRAIDKFYKDKEEAAH